MSVPARRHGIEAVHVVVPAHDEEELLPQCLASLDRATAAAVAQRPGLVVRTTVVADRCRDRTAAVALAHPGTDVVVVDAGSVGAARRAGAQHVADHSPLDPARVWLAGTDADTVVPTHWLTAQLLLAEMGAQMVVGAVRPAVEDIEARVRQAWWERHRHEEGHPHVHGANLGLLLHAYLAVGGFPAVPLHEDVLLVEAVKRAGFRWCATACTRVVTSGRLQARVRGGFAGYLTRLADAAS